MTLIGLIVGIIVTGFLLTMMDRGIDWLLFWPRIHWRYRRANNWPLKRPPDMTPMLYRLFFSDRVSEEKSFVPAEIDRNGLRNITTIKLDPALASFASLMQTATPSGLHQIRRRL